MPESQPLVTPWRSKFPWRNILLLACCVLLRGPLPVQAQIVESLADIPIPISPDWANISLDANSEPAPTTVQPTTSAPVPDPNTPPPATSNSDVVDFNPWRTTHPDRYIEADYLLWWAGSSRLPPLLTSNPSGTSVAEAGLLGAPSTSLVYGANTVGDWPHSGIRLRGGQYFQNRRLSRFEIDFWHSFEGTDTVAIASANGDPILGRPFFDSSTAQPNSQLLSYPGLADGAFTSRYTRQAIGVDPLIFFCLRSNECRWLEFFTGYRFLWLHDSVALRENLQLAPGGLVAPGSRFEIEDSFEATNSYHLLPLGLSWSGNRGKWIWNIRGDIGFGINREMVEVHGHTFDYTSDQLTGSYDAGLLALGTNSGRHTRTRLAWVPQLSFNLRRQLGEQATLSIGYTLINLNNAVQAANHIPTIIDSRNIPPVLPGAGPDPQFAFHDQSLWIHGFNFGIHYQY